MILFIKKLYQDKEDNMKNLILIAAPGAGKGTLSKDLKEKYNYTHI